MKTIGVLGGLGPQATMDFEQRIHEMAQRIISPDANRGYPPMLVYYHRQAPVIVGEDNLPVMPLRLDPGLLRAAGWLGEKTDFLVITANGPHQLISQIEAAARRSVLSMIEATLAEVERRNWQRVGLLGYGDPQVSVYADPLKAAGLAAETIGPDLQGPINQAVIRLMEGRADRGSTAAVQTAVELLRAKGVDGMILGCTELPLLLGELADAGDLLNPAQLLAEAAVRRAVE